ncbi:MAG: hypothetical protein AAF970_02970 [Bacteroidota bacterium]
MRFSRCFLVFLLMSLPAGLAQAQNTNDGSIYSRFGLGDLHTPGTSQAQAMGLTGTALFSYNYGSLANPALWSDQVFTRASVGFAYRGVESTDATDATSRLTSGALGAVQFSFPILDRRLGASFGFRPYSRVNYRVQTAGDLNDPTLSNPIPFTVDYEGSGGLQEITGGLGYRFSPRLSVGLSGAFTFGIVEDVQRTRFATALYDPAVATTSTRLYGLTATGGAMLSFPNLLSEEDVLHVGATLTLPTLLDGERLITRGESLDRDTLSTVDSGSMRLPLRANLGLTYRLDNRWQIGVEGLFEPWSDFRSDFALNGYVPNSSTDALRDRVRVGGGVEVLPAGNDLLDSFFRRTAYRLGFYYDRTYITPNPDVNLRAVAATAGLSLPTLLTGTRIDINLEVGTRGTTDQNLVRDLFYGVSLTVNAGERWFIKRRLR